MSDDELVDERFRLYDFADDLESGSDGYRFAEGALKVIHALETERGIRRVLRRMCAAAAPDLDADAFAEALPVLARFQRQLGESDVEQCFRGALEVAERRAQCQPPHTTT